MPLPCRLFFSTLARRSLIPIPKAKAGRKAIDHRTQYLRAFTFTAINSAGSSKPSAAFRQHFDQLTISR
jgi:hypothetical protein